MQKQEQQRVPYSCRTWKREPVRRSPPLTLSSVTHSYRTRRTHTCLVPYAVSGYAHGYRHETIGLQGGAVCRWANCFPQDAQNTFSTKNSAKFPLCFCSKPCWGDVKRPWLVRSAPPPIKRVPPPRQISSYTYA